jgi:hypothetical protein
MLLAAAAGLTWLGQDLHKVGRQLLMQYTQYFLSVRNRPNRAGIRVEWIALAIRHPLFVEEQSDGRVRHWIWVPEAQRYLRVVLLADGETVHNAFFDRRFREE